MLLIVKVDGAEKWLDKTKGFSRYLNFGIKYPVSSVNEESGYENVVQNVV